MTASAHQPSLDLLVRFTTHLIEGEFVNAHRLLTIDEQHTWTEETLATAWQDLIQGEDPEVVVDQATIDPMEGWPTREHRDAAWVYVPVCSEDEDEGLSAIAVETDKGLRLRNVEFGRP